MTVDSASEYHTELSFYPTGDLYEIMTIAMLANIIGLKASDVCKVSVNFVYKPLTGETRNEKVHTPGGDSEYECDDCQLEI